MTAAGLTADMLATQLAKDKEGVLMAVPPQMEMLAFSTWHTAGTGAGAGAMGKGTGVEEGVRVGRSTGAGAGAEGQLTTVGGVCTAAQTDRICQI